MRIVSFYDYGVFSTYQNRCTNLWYILDDKIVQYQSKNLNSLITKYCLYNYLSDYKTWVCNKIIPAKSSSGDTVVIASFKIYDSRIGFIYEPRQWRLRNIIFVLSVFYFLVHLPTQRPLIKNKQDGLWKHRGVFLFLYPLRIRPNYIMTCTWTLVCVILCVCVCDSPRLWVASNLWNDKPRDNGIYTICSTATAVNI